MLVCIATVLVGFTEPWTNEDKAVLKTTTQNCSKYYPEAPCLKKLVKKQDRVYHAICGEKIKQ